MLSFRVEEEGEFNTNFHNIAQALRQDEVGPEEFEQFIDTDTKQILLNVDPNYYTAWELRFRALPKTEASLTNELQFCDEFSLEHEKSFSLWQYRRRIVTILISIINSDQYKEIMKDELINCRFRINRGINDQKNHGLWSYRSYLIDTILKLAETSIGDMVFKSFCLECITDEINDTRNLISQDIWNNSSWSYLYQLFLTHRVMMIKDEKKEESTRIWYEEVLKTVELIVFRPNNVCIWNYFERLYSSCNKSSIDNIDLSLPLPSDDNLPKEYFIDLFNKCNIDEPYIKYPKERMISFLMRHKLEHIMEEFGLLEAS